MKNLREFLLGMTLSVSAFGAEFKLPEKFLVFDPSRIFSTRASRVSNAAPLPLTPPKTRTDTCAHIRILTPPPDVDPGIALPGRSDSQSNMPVLQAPPACHPQDR